VASNGFVLAVTFWRLGEKNKARAWFDKASESYSLKVSYMPEYVSIEEIYGTQSRRQLRHIPKLVHGL
jgi:hypothetical protein